jgi:tRNA(Glu) U13 pseudouridine synthase TruD
LEDFHVPQLPFLTLKGSKRKAFSKIEKLDVRIEEDELFSLSKKIVLSFELDSGTYATTFLEGFFVLK